MGMGRSRRQFGNSVTPWQIFCSDTAADIMSHTYYWTRVATTVAQGSGMHRRSELQVAPWHTFNILQRWTITTQPSRQTHVETGLVDIIDPRPIGSGGPGPLRPDPRRKYGRWDGLGRRLHRRWTRSSSQVSPKLGRCAIFPPIRKAMWTQHVADQLFNRVGP